MPPRRQPRSRTGPSSTASIHANARVTKPTKRSASNKTIKGKQSTVDSLSPDSSQVQVPATPPQKKPHTPVTPQTGKRTGNQIQIKTKEQSLLTPQSPVTTPELAPSTQAANAIDAQAKVESKIKYDIDEEALALPEADINRYWKGVLESRITPQIHQEGVSLYEKILRHFDLSSKYGPCIGIARIRRWRRAHRLNLKPPIEVLAVLLKLEERNESRQMAYIDALLS